jgi:excisionase family DNA binding protein
MAAQLVSVEAAGRALGVSRSTIWRMIQRGTLPSVRQRGRRLVRVSALENRKTSRPSRQLRALTLDHPIFRLVGAGRGGGQAPGARDKHAILDR